MISVLIAEDELLIRMGLESSIPWEELGFHIVAAVSDGQKAWDAYRRYHPDVLITDIRMPKLDGMELIKRIRQENQAYILAIEPEGTPASLHPVQNQHSLTPALLFPSG